jgi:sporulation protein YlmC with PRC-barrel domain
MTDVTRLTKTSEVLKLNLTGREGEKLGSVREAFLNLSSGAIEFLIVEANSLLGTGKVHPVPWSAVRFDDVDDAFKAPMTKEQFKASPSYDRDQLADANYGWHEQASKYFSNAMTPPPVLPPEQGR